MGDVNKREVNGELRTATNRAWALPFDEQPAYLEHAGESLYVFSHSPRSTPIGKVLLIGPFASGRPDSYIPWVTWARHLAAEGFEVLRFDYRGVGESTGLFTQMTFTSWYADTLYVAQVLAERRGPDIPLALHGLGLGGLFAARALEAGAGCAMVAWGKQRSARDTLLEYLRKRIAQDAWKSVGPRKQREDYIAELEGGGTFEVEDYDWTGALWEDSARWGLNEAEASVANESAPSASRHPRKFVELTQQHGELLAGIGQVARADPTTRLRPLKTDTSALFAETTDWLREHASTIGSHGRP